MSDENPIQSVPFIALGGLFESDDVAAAARVAEAAALPGGNFFPLPEENDFQSGLAEHEGAKKAVAVNACGTALDLCMMVLGVGPGDEVITTPLTFICTATCASVRGAKIVFADIDPDTLNLDPAKARAKITRRTKAIIPVHFGGLAADVEAFAKITEDTGVPVIYDAAHAVGARRNGSPIGGAGRASCYSFQSNKNMTTLGEGGAVTTDDEDFAEQVRRKKTFGYVYGGPSVRVVTQGFNYRLTKPQLAVGRTQLAKIDRVNALKRDRARMLHERLKEIPGIILPAGIDDDGHALHLYVIRVHTDVVSFSRDDLQKHLKEKYQVGTAVHYPAVWDWEVFPNDAIDYDNSDCDVAAQACNQVLSLPVFPASTPEQMEYVAESIRRSINDLGG
jgi:dTDP-4-amino-4,6-dideoxygalactose transaminase